jgi:hypothetical protein
MTQAKIDVERMKFSRRTAFEMAAAMLTLGVAGADSADDDFRAPKMTPTLQWEFTARIAWANGRNPTGVYTAGQRIYNTISGGSFEGPRLRGTVLPGGGDWALMNPPDAKLYSDSAGRSVSYDARYILRTHDGVHIYVYNRGGKFNPEAGEKQTAAASSFGLSTPLFDTPIGSRYRFLSRNIYVGLSKTLPNDTLLYVYRLIP